MTSVRSAGTSCQCRSQCYPMASPLRGVTTPWGNHAGSQKGKLEFHSKKPAWDQRKRTQDTRGSGGRGRSGRVSAATPSGAGTEVFIPHHPGDRGGRRSPSHSGLRPSPHLPLLASGPATSRGGWQEPRSASRDRAGPGAPCTCTSNDRQEMTSRNPNSWASVPQLHSCGLPEGSDDFPVFTHLNPDVPILQWRKRRHSRGKVQI